MSVICTYVYIYIHTTRKASWNPGGVEPIHWKLAHIEPSSRISGTHQKYTLVSKFIVQIKQKGDTGVDPASKKLLGRYTAMYTYIHIYI